MPTIKNAPSGENTSPDGTEGIPLSGSKWIQVLNLIIRKIRETGGPTTLSLGSIPDNYLLQRSSTSLIGVENLQLKNITILSSGSGTFTPDSKTTLIEVELVGGGGGGGGGDGGSSQAGVGGGGGSGACVRHRYTAPAASYSYSVGAGGAGGNAGNNAGSDGGDTTFDTLTAGKGTGGASVAAGTTAVCVTGGAGGVASGGDINIAGSDGGTAIRLDGSNGVSGFGAVSIYGGSPRGRVLGVGNVGIAGAAPGAGGGGGGSSTTTDRAGGAGAAGQIIVREYGAP